MTAAVRRRDGGDRSGARPWQRTRFLARCGSRSSVRGARPGVRGIRGGGSAPEAGPARAGERVVRPRPVVLTRGRRPGRATPGRIWRRGRAGGGGGCKTHAVCREIGRSAGRRLRVNTQLTCDPGQLAVALTLPLPDLQHHLHCALAQLIRVLLLCRHGPASSQESEPPRFLGWSRGRPPTFPPAYQRPEAESHDPALSAWKVCGAASPSPADLADLWISWGVNREGP